jgi:NAD kinase
MQDNKIETAIIVKSKTRLELLTAQFNTKAQAKFYIGQNRMQFNEMRQQSSVAAEQVQVSRSRVAQPNVVTKQSSATPPHQTKPLVPGDFGDYEAEHKKFMSVLERVQKEASSVLKTKVIERDFLPSYIFTEKDLVIVIGQDGLVANTAKYVNDNPIIAINPDPERFDGKLLPFSEKDTLHAIRGVMSGAYRHTDVTMARATLLDGQTLLAFNDLFIGIRSHASARYRITFRDETEDHSSCGIIVSTGAGSTGWLSSLYNMAKGINRFVTGEDLIEYEPLEKDADSLVFIVREPFLSKTSQAGLSCGTIGMGEELILESSMPQDGIIFSDGIFSDFLNFNSGAIATISIASQKARLVQR